MFGRKSIKIELIYCNEYPLRPVSYRDTGVDNISLDCYSMHDRRFRLATFSALRVLAPFGVMHTDATLIATAINLCMGGAQQRAAREQKHPINECIRINCTFSPSSGVPGATNL